MLCKPGYSPRMRLALRTILSRARTIAPSQQQQQQQQPRRVHTLRPYQSECIEQTLAALARNVRRQAVSLPVGSGKTVVFANLLQRVPAPAPAMTKTLVLAHRTELIAQAAGQIQRAAPHLHVAIDQGRLRAPLATADVVVASVATLGRQGSRRLAAYEPQRFKCLIIDEAHHAAAPVYQRILDHFTRANPALLVWGCSATLQRHDGLGLHRAFDELVYARGFVQMIRDGWLCRLRAVSVRTSESLRHVRSRLGDFAADQLARAVNCPERNALVAQAYEKLAADRTCTLAFAVDVAHARALERLFAARLGPAQVGCVLGETPAVERARVLAGLASGTVRLVVSCGVLTEGTDIPSVDCVLLARPTRSAGLFQQMVGRGMRRAAGKRDCLVVDFVDALDGPLPQVTVPSLLGLDPAVLLPRDTDVLDRRALARLADEQRAVQPMSREDALALLAARRLQAFAREQSGQDQEQEQDQDQAPDPTPDLLDRVLVRAREHLDPLRLFAQPPATAAALESQSSGSQHVRRLSPFAWVCVSPTRYLLSTRTTVFFVTYHVDTGLWRGSMMHQGAFRSRERPLDLKALALAHAVRAVDTVVRGRCPRHEISTLAWRAAWRDRPATERQRAALARLGVRARDSGSPRLLSLSRGAAANLFLRLSHGATAAWRRAEADLARARLVAAAPQMSRVVWRDIEAAAAAAADEGTEQPPSVVQKPPHAGLWSDGCD